MVCYECGSERILKMSGKCDDRFSATIGDRSYQDYVPRAAGIGGGDYLALDMCLDCGQVQGTFPIKLIEGLESVDE